jgi:hypothetical protein
MDADSNRQPLSYPDSKLWHDAYRHAYTTAYRLAYAAGWRDAISYADSRRAGSQVEDHLHVPTASPAMPARYVDEHGELRNTEPGLPGRNGED